MQRVGFSGRCSGKSRQRGPANWCWDWIHLIGDLGHSGCSEIPGFAEDPQLLQVAECPTGGEGIQKDLTELSKWTNMWKMSFSVGECGVSIGKKLSVPGPHGAEPGTTHDGAQNYHQQFSEIISSVCNGS